MTCQESQLVDLRFCISSSNSSTTRTTSHRLKGQVREMAAPARQLVATKARISSSSTNRSLHSLPGTHPLTQ